ncbi:MAG: DUF2851 family protein [Verrucomicrobiota bacterium]
MRKHSYGAMRLKESAEIVPDELFVQRLWFENLYKDSLKTTDGRTILIRNPGFWNRGAGPDFLNAALEVEGMTLQGPIEIHMTPDGFQAHGHDKDPAYRDLVLHIVWTRGLSGTAPENRRGQPIPVVELSGQLKVPLSEAKSCFAATTQELEVGARVGRCHKTLATMSDDEVVRLVEEAGWFRFHQRAARWRMKSRRGIEIPDDEWLWQGLAEVLGYSKNREAMVHVAQVLPISEIQKHDDLTREALLFGISGWMCEPAPKSLSQHVRKLWDVWWQYRGHYPEMPTKTWKLSGIRPVNRPERRLAALVYCSRRRVFDELRQALAESDGKKAKAVLLKATHEEWDYRFSLKGKVSAKANRLIGSDKCDAFLFNVFWPLAHRHDPGQVEDEIRKMTTSYDSLAARRARVRLLENMDWKGFKNRLLAVEGLLQIYRDFCLEDRSSCGQCEFPEWIQQWRA